MKFSKRTKKLACVTALLGVGAMASTIKDQKELIDELDYNFTLHDIVLDFMDMQCLKMENFIIAHHGQEVLNTMIPQF